MRNPLIWLLKDDRPGNYSQSLNLANALDFNYQIKEITFNKLAILPNFLKFGRFSTITQKSKNNLINQATRPNIVIAAGRRSALVALDLKKIYPDLFLIQIMNPGKMILAQFDIVIVPDHDQISGPNIIKIIGSIATIKEEQIEKTYQEFAPVFAKIKSLQTGPKIALLLGGSAKNAKFLPQDAQILSQITTQICANMKANLLVTTSRRTDKFLIDEFKENEKVKYFFEWKKDKKNPYLAILKAADFIIVTGDSIGMCTEACNLGKPVYIYANKRICSKKHLKFLQNLFKNNFAQKLEINLQKLDFSNPKKLDELSRVTPVIHKILKNKIDIN